MRIDTKPPFGGARGTYKGTDLIYAENPFSGTGYAYGKKKQPDPRSFNQLQVRAMTRAAAQVWGRISQAQREAWERYAATIGSVARPRRGFDICREAARMRLMMGLDPRADAPAYPAPGPVTGLTLEPAPDLDPRTFAFRVEHAVEAPAASRLLVKVTPATATFAAKPKPRAARCIRGVGPDSFVALPATGGLVTISDARIGVEPGARFGIAVTVIREEDGLASSTSFHDLVRI